MVDLVQAVSLVFVAAACVFNSLAIRSLSRRVDILHGVSKSRSRRSLGYRAHRKGSAK